MQTRALVSSVPSSVARGNDLAAGLQSDLTPGETVFLQSAQLAVGLYQARPDDPWFPGNGPLRLHYLAFPLTRGVEIHHHDRAPFVATPMTLSILGPGDCYRRRALSAEGDRSLYIALTPAMAQWAMEIAPSVLERARGWSGLSGPAPLTPAVTYAARQLANDCAMGVPATRLEVEERALMLVHAVLSGMDQAARAGCGRNTHGGSSGLVQQRKVERAKEYMALHCEAPLTLAELGRVAATTPSHLARLFRRHAGCAVHEYLVQLRLARSLDLLLAHSGQLADVALRLGFTHHSHFSYRFRIAFGQSPSAYQRRGASGAGARGPDARHARTGHRADS